MNKIKKPVHTNKYKNSFFILFILLLGCDGKNQSQNTPIQSVDAIKSKSKNTNVETDGLHAVCVLRPEKLVKLKAQIGGEIKTVSVRQGDFIKAGQTLATLNTDELELKHERSQIDLDKLIERSKMLNFQIQRTEKELQVVESLTGNSGNFFPRFGKEMLALVEKKSDLSENRLNQNAARIELRSLENQIRKASIRAPFDGTVLSRTVEPGMVVGSVIENSAGGDILFEVADPKKLLAACIAKEADALLLVNGKKATLSIDGAYSADIPGTVNRVSPVISNDSGISRREFFVEFVSKDFPALLSGMNATAFVR